MADDFNILVSCAGRRVALVRYFQRALRDLDLKGSVCAADLDFTGPACHVADRRFTAPLFKAGTFIDDMLALCERERIRLVVPTIDPELPLYAQAYERFAEIGTTLAIGSPEAVAIGADKRETHRWLSELGVPVPGQASIAEVLANPSDWPTPLIVKPARGSSSIGLQRIARHEQLAVIDRAGEMVVESIAPGQEYTIDVYIDRSGRPRCAVPRQRLETRSGEVSKGLTVRNAALQALAMKIAAALPGAFGVINVQIFLDPSTDKMAVIEINPRFGGGYPLTQEAGANYTRSLVEDVLGRSLSINPDAWRDGLAMLRYDEAVYVDRSGLDQP
ncbi:MAG: ATP-grasp domain-containing protein [Phycisphaeraceae bacterium]